MELYTSVDSNFKISSSSSLTIGTFDGLHLGHRFLIEEMIKKSKENENTSVLVTFSPNPYIVINSIEKSKYHLLSKHDKHKIIENLGVDVLLELSFDLEMSKISANDFLKKYIIDPFNPRNIIIGYDHHFGYKRKGDSDFLIKNQKNYNYQLEIVDGYQSSGEIISSSRIRNFLSDGKILRANDFIGRSYRLKGKIVEGAEIGRAIDFPTANLEIESIEQIIPKNGVYCIEAVIDDEKYKGMCNIGFNPTVSNEGKLSFEVHIFNYNNFNLYGKYIDIEFVDYVRSEIKFDNLDLLKAQLIKDKEYCESL